jgi:hypothetical protein
MTADLDCDVSPVAVQNMEGEVVDVRVRLLSTDESVLDVPDRCLGPAFNDEEESFLNLRSLSIFLGNVVLLLAVITMRTGTRFSAAQARRRRRNLPAIRIR